MKLRDAIISRIKNYGQAGYQRKSACRKTAAS